MTGEGESVMLMLGDSFMECAEDFATEFCEQKQEVRYVDATAGAFVDRASIFCVSKYVPNTQCETHLDLFLQELSSIGIKYASSVLQ